MRYDSMPSDLVTLSRRRCTGLFSDKVDSVGEGERFSLLMERGGDDIMRRGDAIPPPGAVEGEPGDSGSRGDPEATEYESSKCNGDATP